MTQPRTPASRPSRSMMQRMADHRRLLLPAALVLVAGIGGAAYYVAGDHATPEERILHAQQLFQAGDYKAATIQLKNALQEAPANAEGRFLLGRLHFVNNDFVNAEKELRQALERGYVTPEATLLLARTLLLVRQPKKLLDEIRLADSTPVDAQAALQALRAQAALMLGDKASAEASLLKANELLPEHPDTLAVNAGQAFAAGQHEEALALVGKAVVKAPKRADLLIMKADVLRVLKRADEAVVAYQAALVLEPANLGARLAVVQHHLGGSNLDKASAELKILKSYAPNNLMARYLDGLIEFRRKNLDAAAQRLQDVLRGAPDFAPANLLAGAIDLSQGKRESAITRLNRVLEAAPDHPLARKLLAAAMLESGQADRAETLIADLKGEEDVQLLALQGNIALRQGDYKEARQKLEQASTLAPENMSLVRELAASRMASGDEGGAIEALTRLAEKDVSTHQADVLLVMTHMKAKRHDAALKVIDELERRHPRLPLSENLRGAVQLAQNQPDKARQSFTKALTIDPGYLAAASNLARLDLANKDIKSARSRFEQVLKHSPKSVKAAIALAELAAIEKNEADHVKYLEQAKHSDPKDATSRQMLTRYWLSKRDAGKALAEARSALDATGNAAFHGLIGASYALQGDVANTQSAFGKWVETQPNDPMAHYQLALAQNSGKDRKAALKSLDKALSLRPDFVEAGMAKALLLGHEGRVEEGLTIAKGLQTRVPKAAAGYLAEAELQFLVKNYGVAAKLYVQSAQMSDRSAPMANAYRAYTAAGQSGEGEKALKTWLGTHTNDAQIRHLLALSMLNAKRLPEAMQHYDILARSNPRDVVAYNNLAWIQGELNNPNAVATAEKAHSLSPDNPSTLDTLGWNLVKAGQYQRGLDLIRKAQEKAPDATEIQWHLAAGLAKSGDRARARQELERLLKSGNAFPQEAEARKLLGTL